MATTIGGAKQEGKTRHQYRMLGACPFFLASLVKPLDNLDYAATIITRDSHPKVKPYHDLDFPCFAPLSLAGNGLANNLSPSIQNLLDHPTLTASISATPVKSYKYALPLGEIVVVPAAD